MGRRRARLALAGLLFVCASHSAAADQSATYGIKEAAPATGSMVKRSVITGNVPFDKTYAQLTPEQRQHVKDNYEAMPADDEPPFPVDGLAPMMKALQKGASLFHVNGTLAMTADIGPDGQPRKIDVLKAPDDPQFRQFAVSLLMITRYKPAVCGGKPCAMGFPLEVSIVSSTPP